MKKIDWNAIVINSGHSNLRAMFEDMYIDKRMPPHIMALRLGVSLGTIWAQLQRMNIKRGRSLRNKAWGSRGGS